MVDADDQGRLDPGSLATELARAEGPGCTSTVRSADVVFTQVCATFEDDERTAAVARRLWEDGTVWMTGSRWRDRVVLRISVSNWSTTADDVNRSLAALRAAAAGAPR